MYLLRTFFGRVLRRQPKDREKTRRQGRDATLKAWDSQDGETNSLREDVGQNYCVNVHEQIESETGSGDVLQSTSSGTNFPSLSVSSEVDKDKKRLYLTSVKE